MGGPGSGNRYHWWRSSKKTTTEECLSLDSVCWTREGILKAHVLLAGRWGWTYRRGAGLSLDYQVNTLDLGAPFVALSYSWIWPSSDQVQRERYTVYLTATRPRFGGLRWWFRCPLTARGRSCNRRVGKLFLPPGSRYFGCRHCHDLTYKSCQESGGMAGFWQRLGVSRTVRELEARQREIERTRATGKQGG